MLYVSRAHKALIVPRNKVTAGILPGARPFGEGSFLAPHTLQNTLLLKHVGYECPSPVMHYDYRGGKPFDVQKRTVEMLVENPHAYVLNGMGTGKTKTALWAWDVLNQEGAAKKLLVVCPLSTMKFVWAREVFNTIPGKKVEILHGTREERLAALGREADVYVINHDGLKTIYDALLAQSQIDTLVLDELAVYRNNSERSKMMRKFAQKFEIVWGMTGTPMPNEPTDVWALAKIISPHTVSKYRQQTKELLMTRISQYVWKPKPNAVELAFGMLQPSVRYALDDVVELPAIIERMVEVDLSAQQKSVYDKVSKEMVAQVAAKKITAVNAGAAMQKLLQITGGWVYTQSPEFVRLDAAPRVAALIDLINSAERKVIAFVPYRHAIEGIGGIFERLKAGKKIDFDHCMVHGDTKDRDQIFHLFQNSDKYKVMLAHPGCIHHGLTLTAADTAIWYLPITSLETYDQANARIRRIGQKHRQQVLHLHSTPIERRIYTMLRTKQKVQDALLQLFEDDTILRHGAI